MSKSRKVLQVIVFSATAAIASGAQGHDWSRIPFRAVGSLTGKVILPDDPTYATYGVRCGGAPVQVIQGSGDSRALGLFTDTQSHCLGAPAPDPKDSSKVVLPFAYGIFTFTNASGQTVIGKYYGKLRETTTSVPPPNAATPPTGAWLIDGQVCISGGTLFNAIEDDCAAGHYFPASGISFLDPLSDNVNATTLFLHQTIGVMSRW